MLKKDKHKLISHASINHLFVQVYQFTHDRYLQVLLIKKKNKKKNIKKDIIHMT